MKKATKVILGTTAAAAAFSFGGGYDIFNEVMNRNAPIFPLISAKASKSMQNVQLDETVDPRIQWLNEQEYQEYEIINSRNFRLKAHMIPAAEPSKKFVFCSHGYRCHGRREFRLMAKFWHDNGFNVFMIDHQAHGDSDGKYIGFGYHESLDGLLWLKFMLEKFGDDIEIVLHGVSMGSATVMMMTGAHDLPANVKFTVADCGYTSCTAEFEHCLKDYIHLPNFPLLYTADLFNRTLNGFDFNDVAPIESVGRAKIPMLFVHGDADDFVPTYMVHQVYSACSSDYKDLLLVKGAGHAESYAKDPDSYNEKLSEFIDKFITK